MNKEQEANIDSGLFANMVLQLLLWILLFLPLSCRFDAIDKDLKQLKDSVIIPEKSPEQLKIEDLEKLTQKSDRVESACIQN